MIDFYDMGERVSSVVNDLQSEQANPELEGEVADLIRELTTIADVLYTLIVLLKGGFPPSTAPCLYPECLLPIQSHPYLYLVVLYGFVRIVPQLPAGILRSPHSPLGGFDPIINHLSSPLLGGAIVAPLCGRTVVCLPAL